MVDAPTEEVPMTVNEIADRLSGILGVKVAVCPECGGPMVDGVCRQGEPARRGFDHTSGHEQASESDADDDGDYHPEIGQGDRPAEPLRNEEMDEGEITDNPFVSEDQRRYLWANHPDIAERWAHGEHSSDEDHRMPEKTGEDVKGPLAKEERRRQRLAANEFASDEQRNAFFGLMKGSKLGAMSGKAEAASAKATGKAGHAKAAGAHTDAAKAHWAAMKSEADKGLAAGHRAAAKEHFAKAKEHDAKAGGATANAWSDAARAAAMASRRAAAASLYRGDRGEIHAAKAKKFSKMAAASGKRADHLVAAAAHMRAKSYHESQKGRGQEEAAVLHELAASVHEAVAKMALNTEERMVTGNAWSNEAREAALESRRAAGASQYRGDKGEAHAASAMKLATLAAASGKRSDHLAAATAHMRARGYHESQKGRGQEEAAELHDSAVAAHEAAAKMAVNTGEKMVTTNRWSEEARLAAAAARRASAKANKTGEAAHHRAAAAAHRAAASEHRESYRERGIYGRNTSPEVHMHNKHAEHHLYQARKADKAAGGAEVSAKYIGNAIDALIQDGLLAENARDEAIGILNAKAEGSLADLNDDGDDDMDDEYDRRMDEEDGDDPIAGEDEEIVPRRGKMRPGEKVSANERLALLPPEDQAALKFAKEIVSNEQKALVNRLIDGVDPNNRTATLNFLRTKDIEELRSLSLLQSKPQVRRLVEPGSLVNYLGAAGAVVNKRTDVDREDVLPLPTMNYDD